MSYRKMFTITDLYLTTVGGVQEDVPLIPYGTPVMLSQCILDPSAAGGADCFIVASIKVQNYTEQVEVWCELEYLSPSRPAPRSPTIPLKPVINPLDYMVAGLIIRVVVVILSSITTRLWS